jgi:hypothetical protein
MLNAIILGIVQGLTSSCRSPRTLTAPRRAAARHRQDPGAAFTAIIQLGTELAVIVTSGADLWRIISRWFLASFSGGYPRNDPDAKMGWFIILGSVPIVVARRDLPETTIPKPRCAPSGSLPSHSSSSASCSASRTMGAKKRRLRDLTAPHAAIYGGAQAPRSSWSLALGWHHHRRALPGYEQPQRPAILSPRHPRGLRKRSVSRALQDDQVPPDPRYSTAGDRRSNGRLFHGQTCETS